MNSNISTIRFSPDGFCLYDPTTEPASYDIAPGPEFIEHMQEALLENLPTATPPEALCCEIETTRLVLLPPDTKKSLIEEMYRLTFVTTEDEEQIITQPVTLSTGQEVILCFGFSKSLYNFMLRNYENVTFSHPMASLLEKGADMAQGNCLVVRCDARYLEMALFRNKELHFCNTYHTSQAENRTYYVMNTWQQLELDQISDYLLVLGSNNEALQVRASTHRFIKHVFS